MCGVRGKVSTFTHKHTFTTNTRARARTHTHTHTRTHTHTHTHLQPLAKGEWCAAALGCERPQVRQAQIILYIRRHHAVHVQHACICVCVCVSVHVCVSVTFRVPVTAWRTCARVAPRACTHASHGHCRCASAGPVVRACVRACRTWPCGRGKSREKQQTCRGSGSCRRGSSACWAAPRDYGFCARPSPWPQESAQASLAGRRQGCRTARPHPILPRSPACARRVKGAALLQPRVQQARGVCTSPSYRGACPPWARSWF